MLVVQGIFIFRLITDLLLIAGFLHTRIRPKHPLSHVGVLHYRGQGSLQFNQPYDSDIASVRLFYMVHRKEIFSFYLPSFIYSVMWWRCVLFQVSTAVSCLVLSGLFCYRVENLRKGAEPVNNAAIIDMIQTNIFEDIGCGKTLFPNTVNLCP